jgi:hypothetical protein
LVIIESVFSAPGIFPSPRIKVAIDSNPPDIPPDIPQNNRFLTISENSSDNIVSQLKPFTLGNYYEPKHDGMSDIKNIHRRE